MHIFETGIRVVACPNCRSTGSLALIEDHVRCRNCGAGYRIVDGVLDLMPGSYDGYPGDSIEAANLRDTHNRQSLHADTVHLRSTLDHLLRPKALVLDAGCGTGQLAKLISEAHPGVTIVATDVSLPMCRLAARNCRGHLVLVVRTPTTINPPMPFRNTIFDLVLCRLAPMDRGEAFRLLRPGGYTVEAGLIDAHWHEFWRVFDKDRSITFPRDLEPKEALAQAGFSQTESHEWRFPKTRSLDEIILMLRYAPILHDFDETADQPLLSKLAALYGDRDGIRLTEGEKVIIGRKAE